MGTLIASVIAVLGTLAGSALTFWFQRHTTRRTERFTRSQQLWQEQVAAFSGFAASLTDFRRSQNDRWHLEQADARSSEFIAARATSYELRAAATSLLCRVRRVSGSTLLGELAQVALDAATEVHLARDEHDRAGRGEQARAAVDRFVEHASAHVHAACRP
jgi:hypothetical protein